MLSWREGSDSRSLTACHGLAKAARWVSFLSPLPHNRVCWGPSSAAITCKTLCWSFWVHWPCKSLCGWENGLRLETAEAHSCDPLHVALGWQARRAVLCRCKQFVSPFSWGPLHCAVLQGKGISHSVKRGEVFPASQERWEDKPLECGALDGIRGNRQIGSSPDPWSCQSLSICALAKRRTEGFNQLAFYNIKHV